VTPSADGWGTALEVALAGSIGLGMLIGVALWRRYRLCRRQTDALQREREVMFAFVHDVAEVFSESDEVEVEPLLDKVLSYALRTSAGLSGAVYLVEAGRQELRARAVRGLFPPLRDPIPQDWGEPAVGLAEAVERRVRAEIIRCGEGMVGEVARLGTARLVRDAERDPQVPRHESAHLRIRSLVAVPMRFRNRVMGVLVVVNRTDGCPFTPADLNLLQALADQASVSLHYVMLREELDAKRQLDHDLAVARRIQRALLPRRLPKTPALELAALNVPAREVGGDYYDAIPLDGGRLGLAVADVSGKGVSGALLMSVCRSVLRALAPAHRSAADTLRALNRAVAPDLEGDMFVTAIYMIFDPGGRLSLACAGHEPPILYRPAERGLTRIEVPGVGIGIGEPELFDTVAGETTVQLRAGDLVLAFTDGLSEARDDRGEEFGTDRIMETLVLSGDRPVEEIVHAIEDRVRRFCGGRPPEDDLTLLLLRMRADGGPAVG